MHVRDSVYGENEYGKFKAVTAHLLHLGMTWPFLHSKTYVSLLGWRGWLHAHK